MSPTVYEANQFYGFEETLQRYANWHGPIRAIVPHGVLNPYQVHKELVETAVPAFLAYSHLTAPLAEAARKHVFLSAAPFLYFLQQRERGGRARSSSSSDRLLVFPSHSTTVYTADPIGHPHLRRMHELRANGWEVTVCMYYRDLELGRAATLEKAGFDVITCGHRTDSRFVDRFVAYVEASTAVAGDSFGSHMFYAACLGRPYFLLSESEETRKHLDWLAAPRAQHLRVRSILPDGTRTTYEEMINAFGRTQPPSDLEPQLRTAHEILGNDNLLSPADLRHVFEQCRRLDFVNLRRPHGGPLVPAASRTTRKVRLRLYRSLQRVRGN